MVAKAATLIVTAPNWAQRKSFIASDLSRLCEEAGIGLIDAPVMRIEMTNDAERVRSCVRLQSGMQLKTKRR